MPDWDAIGAIGEVAGAAAVIVTIIYLARQVHRSDETARAESLRAVLDGYRERSVVHYFATPGIVDLFAMGLTDFDRLDDSQKRRFLYAFAENVFQGQQAMELFQRGLLAKIDYDAWIYYVGTLVQTPGGRAVWPYIEVTITPTIRDTVNDYLETHPGTPSYLELNPLMKFDFGKGEQEVEQAARSSLAVGASEARSGGSRT